MTRGLLLAAAMLLASTAAAQAPNANPQGKGHAADPAKNAGAPGAPGAKAEDKKDKAEDKKDKAEDKKDKAEDKKDKADDKAKEGGERAARKAKEHEAQKAKLSAWLKGPPDDALKQELRRHAERVARIERIKSVATDAKDTDAGERATKLLVKENARHDKWMEKQAGTSTPTAAPAAQPATREGAKGRASS